MIIEHRRLTKDPDVLAQRALDDDRVQLAVAAIIATLDGLPPRLRRRVLAALRTRMDDTRGYDSVPVPQPAPASPREAAEALFRRERVG